jgi:hypothetical protein
MESMGPPMATPVEPGAEPADLPGQAPANMASGSLDLTPSWQPAVRMR